MNARASELDRRIMLKTFAIDHEEQSGNRWGAILALAQRNELVRSWSKAIGAKVPR